MVIIVDYGTGNSGSILNMLNRVCKDVALSSRVEDIEKAEKLIFPGVGSFDMACRNISDSNLMPVLNKKVMVDKIPVLGICLGMQLFTNKSEEGAIGGLGWIRGRTMRFNFGNEGSAKIPHMGWNSIKSMKKSPLFNDLCVDSRFYFAHSYHVVCEDEKDILTTTFHGHDFISSVEKENIIGVQFHPEKSHRFGIQLFKNFVELY